MAAPCKLWEVGRLYMAAWRRYHLRFRRAFSNKVSPTVTIIAIFSDFCIKITIK